MAPCGREVHRKATACFAGAMEKPTRWAWRAGVDLLLDVPARTIRRRAKDEARIILREFTKMEAPR